MKSTHYADGREIRLRRLLGDGRAVVIAIDHGMFDGPIPALENLPATAEKITPLVDAVLLAPGMLRHCSDLFAHPRRPLAIVRLNWNTIYCFKYGYRGAKSVTAYDPDSALREGMDIALVSLTLGPGGRWRLIASSMEIRDFGPLAAIQAPHCKIANCRDIRDWLTAYAKAGGPHHQALCFGDARPRIRQVASMLGADYFEI